MSDYQDALDQAEFYARRLVGSDPIIVRQCTGCVYHYPGYKNRTQSVCGAPTIGPINPFDGTRVVRRNWSRIEDMRSPDGACGPEAKLYREDTWKSRLLKWLCGLR